MNQRRKVLEIVIISILFCCAASFFVNCLATERKDDLGYKVILRIRTKEPRPLLKLRIVLINEEPSKENLLRLCHVLRATYEKESRIEADVFSTKEGAKKFSDATEFSGHTDYYETWRARYQLDRIEQKEYLDFTDGPNEIGKKMQRVEMQ